MPRKFELVNNIQFSSDNAEKGHILQFYVFIFPGKGIGPGFSLSGLCPGKGESTRCWRICFSFVFLCFSDVFCLFGVVRSMSLVHMAYSCGVVRSMSLVQMSSS